MRNNKRKGFSVIELVIVISIMSVLAAIMTPLMIGSTESAKIARAETEIDLIAKALQAYFLDYGDYHSDLLGGTEKGNLGSLRPYLQNVKWGRGGVSNMYENWIQTPWCPYEASVYGNHYSVQIEATTGGNKIGRKYDSLKITIKAYDSSYNVSHKIKRIVVDYTL